MGIILLYLIYDERGLHMKIFLTRHGETEWNRIGYLQGWLNSDLTAKGERDAEALGERLADVALDAVYSSDLGRATQTAELIINNRDVAWVKTSKLRELSLGAWEGNSYEYSEESDPELYDYYMNHPDKYIPEVGENFSDLMVRIGEVLDEITGLDAESVLIVTHGVTLIGILNYINGVPIDEFWSSPVVKGTSLTIIDYEDGVFEIETYADEGHIE